MRRLGWVVVAAAAACSASGVEVRVGAPAAPMSTATPDATAPAGPQATATPDVTGGPAPGGTSTGPPPAGGAGAAVAGEPGRAGDLVLPIDPADAPAIITPTGVPVAVLATIGDGLVVRSPCGRIVVVGTGEPIRGAQVVLDPGHGGPIDTGAVGPNGLVERDLNLRVARAAQAELERRGISVVSTRTGDYGTTLASRAALADAVGARALVSIHHNAPRADPSAVPGTEVFVQTGSAESARLGGLLWEHAVAALVAVEGVEWEAAPDAGVLTVVNSRDGADAYGMIRRPATPTALVELGYLANPSEAELMASNGYVALVAAALADAIAAYLETNGPGRGFVAEPRVFDPLPAPGTADCTDPPLE